MYSIYSMKRLIQVDTIHRNSAVRYSLNSAGWLFNARPCHRSGRQHCNGDIDPRSLVILFRNRLRDSPTGHAPPETVWKWNKNEIKIYVHMSLFEGNFSPPQYKTVCHDKNC